VQHNFVKRISITALEGAVVIRGPEDPSPRTVEMGKIRFSGEDSPSSYHRPYLLSNLPPV
jgi:hypothetical protein